MNVLVINPPNTPWTASSLLIEPIDVLTVATYIRSLGHTVALHDFDHERKTATALLPLLKRTACAVVVIPFDYHIPLYTAEAKQEVIAMTATAVAAGCRVILGGRPATYHAEAFLRGHAATGSNCTPPHPNQASVVVIRHEMEPALGALLGSDDWTDYFLGTVPATSWIAQDNTLTHSAAPRQRFPLDSLPIADRSLLPIHSYIDVHSLLSSRGCVERCSFCPVHGFWGSWRGHSPERVVQEIEVLVERHQAGKILFLDDHATADPRRMARICELLIQRRLPVTLGCLGTAHSLSGELLSLMHTAGFRWIHIGAEYGSDALLTHLRKRTRVADIARAVRSAKAAGLRVRTSWIFDAPQASETELADTIRLILELEPDEIRAHFLTLRAGAPLSLEYPTGNFATTSQYIHAAASHTNLSNIPSPVLERELTALVARLQERGYLVIRNPEDWRMMEDPTINAPGVRFISFCPGRYGIGWQALEEVPHAA